MDRELIIRLAEQAAFHTPVQYNELFRFAALVAAHEREECAKMAEAFHRHGYDFTGDAELHEAIRSRT